MTSNSGLPNHIVEERQDVIFRKVRGILNKITPETFDKLTKELVNVGLDSPRTLRGVIYLLFDKALKDLKYSSLYAKLCQELSEKAPNFEQKSGPNTFCKFLISKCEDEFERRRRATEDFDSKNELTDEEYEQKAIAKEKMLGNIKFICELGKKRLLQEEILHECIRGLLSKKKERPIQDQAQDLECLSQIMRTIGSLLDIQTSKNLMNQYFERIDMFSKKPELPSRIRFMLRDVIDLRNNNWRPRPFQREDNVPQTLSKLREEAGYDPAIGGLSIDKFGNNRNLIGIGDLSKIHGNKLSMLFDDEPSFTTTTDFHWGPAFLPLDPFDAFSSNATGTRQKTPPTTISSTSSTTNTLSQASSAVQKPNLFHHKDPFSLQTSGNNNARFDKQPIMNNPVVKQEAESKRFMDGLGFEKRPFSDANVMNPRNDKEVSANNIRGRPPIVSNPTRMQQRDDMPFNGPRRFVDNRPQPVARGRNVSPAPPRVINRSRHQPHEINQPPPPMHPPNNQNYRFDARNMHRDIPDNRERKFHRNDYVEHDHRNARFSNNTNHRQIRNDRPPPVRDHHYFEKSNHLESELNLNWRAGPSISAGSSSATATTAVSTTAVSVTTTSTAAPSKPTPVTATTTAPVATVTIPVTTVPSSNTSSYSFSAHRPVPQRSIEFIESRTTSNKPAINHIGDEPQTEKRPLADKIRPPFGRNHQQVESHHQQMPESERIPNWRRAPPIVAPNNNTVLKEQIQVQNPNPLLPKPLPTKMSDIKFSLRPSHNLVGRAMKAVAGTTVQNSKLDTNGDSHESPEQQENAKPPKKVQTEIPQKESTESGSLNLAESKVLPDGGSPTRAAARDFHVNKFISVISECSNESSPNFHRIVAKVKELKIPKNYQHECLVSAMKQSILKSEIDRDNIGKLFAQSIPAIFETPSLLNAFKVIFEQMHALEVETPKVKSLVAGFLSQAILDNLLSLEDVGNVLSGGKHHPLFLLFLQKLQQNGGQAWLNEKFVASKIDLINMLPEVDRSKDRLASVLKDRCLGFLDPMLTIEPDLWAQMKERDPSPAAVYRWIKDNVDQTIQNTPTFAHVLISCLLKFIHTTAIERVKVSQPEDNDASNSNKSSPSSSSQGTSDIEQELLTKYQQVLQAMLKDKQMQLATLYALQSFYHGLDFPKGALLRWFHMLYDMNIVDDDVFFIWKEEINDKFPGKGQALFQVNTWLNWLAEAESEEDEEV